MADPLAESFTARRFTGKLHERNYCCINEDDRCEGNKWLRAAANNYCAPTLVEARCRRFRPDIRRLATLETG